MIRPCIRADKRNRAAIRILNLSGCPDSILFLDGIDGFGTEFFAGRDGDKYLIMNAENGSEITQLYSSSVGRVKHVNGRLIVFKNDNKLAVHEVGYSGVSEISSRWV